MNKIENYTILTPVVNEGSNIIISFKEGLTTAMLSKEISALSKPQVIFWYFGSYGLSREGVYFYRNNIKKIQEYNNKPRCWLYDLRAWAAFDTPGKCLQECDPNADRVNSFASSQIKALKSSDFFRELSEETSPSAAAYLRDVVLERKQIYKPSEGKSETGIKIGDIFKQKCLVLERQYSKDTAKCYSAVQYVEGIYLIKKMIQEALEEGGSEDLNIVFALPGDELKYYKVIDTGQNPLACFAMDTRKIMEELFRDRLNGRVINVMFYTFQYKGRPYNANLKDTIMELSWDDVSGRKK